MAVIFQRNKAGQQDMYMVSFGIRVAGAPIGPIKGTVLASSGDTVHFADHLRPNSLRVPSGLWEVGPTEVGADDTVEIAYAVTNIAHSSGESHPTAGEVNTIGFATWAAAVGVAAAATGGTAAVAAAVIGALGAIGEAIISIF